jgi:hypothetical protein
MPAHTTTLFEHRSNIYSGRPRLPFPVDIVDFGRMPALLDDGERLKETRRLFANAIGNKGSLDVYASAHKHAAIRFVIQIMPDSDQVESAIRKYVICVCVQFLVD